MLACIEVGDLPSKPSKAARVIMDINLNLVEHSVVCKNFLIQCVTLSGLLRRGILEVPIEATESETTSLCLRRFYQGGRKAFAHFIDAFSASRYNIHMISVL